ncbi:uncharacterized protein TNCV_2221 [Trichonephila clavipes]|nr:uncharacterized protein TNCV_2221 [Trichonephila clavipes]
MIPGRLNLGQIWGSGRSRKVVTVYRQSCDTLVVIDAFTPGSPHTNTIVITAEFESGFVAKDDGSISLLSSFLVRGTTPNGGFGGWTSRAAYVIGTTIPNILQQGDFICFEKTQGALVKVLPVPGWRPLKQLAVRVHFFRFGVFSMTGLSRAS